MAEKKIAIITGASSGLGSKLAKLVDAGVGPDKDIDIDEIWLIARRENKLKELAESLNTPARTISMDLTNAAFVDEMQGLLATERPNVRVLINCAGFGKIGDSESIAVKDQMNMIDLNCRAAVAMSQITVPYMTANARLVEICSCSGFQPLPYLNVYAASKAFLYRYSRALGVELRKKGVKVVAVCPYWVKDTEFIGKASSGGTAATDTSRFIKSFPLASDSDTIAQNIYKGILRGLAVVTPDAVSTTHRVLCKVLPAAICMFIWEGVRKL